MIVKVQVPIETNVRPEDLLALVYNRERTFETFVKITPELSTKMRGQAKLFFNSRFKNGDLHLEAEVPWQSW